MTRTATKHEGLPAQVPGVRRSRRRRSGSGRHVPGLGDALAQNVLGAEGTEVGAWVVIKSNEDVIIRIARSEMGQGTLTGLAQLVCEELECDWKKVKWEYPTPGKNLARNRIWGDMSTGGCSRHSRIARVCAQGWRGGAHDAAAGGGGTNGRCRSPS